MVIWDAWAGTILCLVRQVGREREKEKSAVWQAVPSRSSERSATGKVVKSFIHTWLWAAGTPSWMSLSTPLSLSEVRNGIPEPSPGAFRVCCHCRCSQLRLTLCDRMDCSTPGFPVLHRLPGLAHAHVCWADDAIQPSRPCPLLLLPQSFPESGTFLMSQPFVSSGQSVGASASVSASVISMNIQGWFPLELTGLISSLSKGLSRVFSNFGIISASPGAWRDRVRGLEILTR